jgi:hypothetical protein
VKGGLDRDRILAKALKQALGAPTDVPAADACLDAETMAAWMEDGLDPAAVALAESHVANCARCQALVGAMARSAPEVPVDSHARSSFWRWWLAPVAAAAAATIVWMVVPDQRFTAPPSAPAADVAKKPPESLVNEPPPEASAPPPPPAASPERPPPAASVPRQEAAAKAVGADDSRRARAAASSELARERQQAADVQEQPAAPDRSAAFSAQVPPLITSPDPAIQWRVGSNGTVDYTTDGGRTWERASTGVTTEIRAGSSPAPGVCWLVGQAGTVLVTSSGRTFTRVSAPVKADLAGVQAVDARTAVVTTADGRTFATDNGGLTWRPRE